jgi:hypothetical protein
MGVVVQPNYAAFTARYPEFASPGGAQPVSSDLYQAYWNEATLYQANDGAGPINDCARALMLMNMLVAHIASLNAPNANGTSASNTVGRVSNASEGSVSVGLDNQYPPGTPQWYQQTKYGSAWWAATAQYRTMRYRPGPVMGVPAGQGYWGGFGGRGFGRGCR